jgi:hypothetical protein
VIGDEGGGGGARDLGGEGRGKRRGVPTRLRDLRATPTTFLFLLVINLEI